MSDHKHENLNKVSFAGLLITLGIIYGDIGTSPLYVMKSIMGESPIDQIMVYGAISCVFWTLTLQTTVKYVIITLKADNNGEGGIFSLYTLVRKRAKWLTVPAIIGGATLLADGIITPPISVASAIEGLRILQPDIPTIPIVIVILSFIFFFQRFGTSVVGSSFGPLMMIWFTMLAVLGINQIAMLPEILYALNPYYAYQLLFENPEGFWLLGAVFLCTTGAEALYSDLGHCGRKNIRVTWIYVKICLILNYFGQGAWLMQYQGQVLGTQNPFYTIMPSWFLIPGIIIATLAAIIASQALITGSFTLISEAVRLNFWPRVKLNYPSDMKGQLYVPSVNLLLWIGCVAVVLYFEESSNMEAAYGLSITITMLMTTILLAYYLVLNKVPYLIIFVFLVIYASIEGAFLVANLVKFMNGGYVTIVIGGLIIAVMWIWLRANAIKNRLTDFININEFREQLVLLSNDTTIPKFATNLVFLSGAPGENEVENKIVYSILQKMPKRADVYWFVHIEVTDEPYTMEYKATVLEKNDIVMVRFRLGFRVEQKISMFFRMVVDEMVKNQEVDVESRYTSLKEQRILGDFRYVLIDQFLSYENDLPLIEKMVMNAYFSIKNIATTPEKWFGLDSSDVTIEKVPIVINPSKKIQLKRIE